MVILGYVAEFIIAFCCALVIGNELMTPQVRNWEVNLKAKLIIWYFNHFKAKEFKDVKD